MITTHFSFKEGILPNPSLSIDEAKTDSPVDTPTVGAWVVVNYEGERFPGIVTNQKCKDFQIRCLHQVANGSYKFEPERETVWYNKTDIVEIMETVPTLLNSRGLYKL